MADKQKEYDPTWVQDWAIEINPSYIGEHPMPIYIDLEGCMIYPVELPADSMKVLWMPTGTTFEDLQASLEHFIGIHAREGVWDYDRFYSYLLGRVSGRVDHSSSE